MLRETLRILAFCLLILVIVMDDFPFYSKMKDQITQFFLAICIIVFVIFDPIFGLIMGFVLLLIYFEIYGKIRKSLRHNDKSKQSITMPIGSNVWDNEQSRKDSCVTQLDYITDEHLLSAQNNIFDEDNMKKEVSSQENICGTQGFHCDNSKIEGFGTENKFHVLEKLQ